MKIFLYVRLLVVVMLWPIIGHSQEGQKIWGRIIDGDEQKIANVTVLFGLNEESMSGSNGEFESSSANELPLTLQFSCIGFKTKVIQVTDATYNPKQGLLIQLEEDAGQLQEILVTVRRDNSYLSNSKVLGGKFSGKLKDLPQSVAIASSEFMEDKGAHSTLDVIEDLAGVTTASSYDDLIIRGFKSGYESGIRLVNGLRSGYSYGNSYYRSPLVLNLESIAVLKGPGASLFGDITPGGTINMVTKKPLEEQKGWVNLSAGSFETLRTSLDLGGPLDKDKKVLYRLNVGYDTSKTFRDVNQQNNFMFAPSFTFKPADGTQVDVDIVYDQFHGYLDRGMPIKGRDFYALPRSFTLSQPSDFYNATNFSISARLSQRIVDNVTWHASYMKSIYSEDVNEHRTLNTFADAPHNTIMNLRFFDRHGKDYTDNMVTYLKWDLFGDKVDHHFIIGLDYAQYKGDKNNSLREARQQVVDGKVVPLTFDMNNPTYTLRDTNNYVWRQNVVYPFLSPYKTTGIYVQDQMSVLNRLKVIMGLRYEHYYSETIDGKNDFNATQNVVIPRLGLSYEINDEINYFASYSQGFSPIGANFIANYADYGATEPFKSETSYQVETGLKTGFFKDQLQIDMSLFHIQRNDMLVSTGEISATGFPMYRQSGEAISRGVEFDIRGQFTKEFQLMANYTFNQTEVKSSSISSEIGQSLPGAPKNMASLWLKYVFSNNALKGLGFGTGVYYVDHRRMDNSVGQDVNGNSEWAYWPSYTTVNAAVYYHISNLKLALNINNVFDTYYFLGGFDYTRAFVGSPRNVVVSLGYNF